MDIKSIQPTAEVTFVLARKEEASVTFTVTFIALDELPEYLPEKGEKVKPSKVIRDILIDAVKGWDLTENGQPIPCDDKNKKKYLPVMFGIRVKVEEGKEANIIEDLLGRRLMDFAGDSENFLKN